MYHWSTADIDFEHRFDAWRSALNQTHLPWQMAGDPSPHFAADIRSLETGVVTVVNCRCDPCAGFRDREIMKQGDDAFYGVLLLRGGRERVRQGEQAYELQAGSAMIWDSSRPIEFEILEPLDKCTLLISRDSLMRLTGSDSLPVGRLDSRRGFGGLFCERINALDAFIEDFDRSSGAQLGLSLVQDLINATGRSGAKPILSPRAALLQRVDQVIEANFARAGFGPEELADRLGVSVRYLHKLLQAQNDTVGRRIRNRRLEAVRADLENPALADVSVTQICFARGFSSPAHLSRAFRERFGLSPSECRLAWRSADDP